jgi:hypothetical protein
MLGGSGTGSASIYAVDVLGPVRVGRDVVGDGTDSANIVSTGFTTSVTIAGSLIGGGDNSALIQSNDVLGPVRIGRDLIGGSGQDSAEIYSPTEVKSVTIGGSVVGGGSLYAGTVFSDGPMGPVFVGGNLRGGVGTQSGSIEAVGNLAGVTIGGSVLSGGGALSGSIMSDATLQRVLIRGNVVGTDAVDVQISGRGTIDNFVAIGSLTILGSAEYVNVLGGYDGATPVFGDARIGTIIVIGDWIAGNIVAGVSAGVDLMFGTPDDVLIAGATTAIASIKSIFIKGQVIGTTAGADHFGFVAEQVGILKIGTVTYPFTAAGIEIEDLGATGDFIAREDV